MQQPPFLGQPLTPQTQQELIAFAEAVRSEVNIAISTYVSNNHLSPNQAAIISREILIILSSPTKTILLQELQRLGQKYPVIQAVYNQVIQGKFTQPLQPIPNNAPLQPRPIAQPQPGQSFCKHCGKPLALGIVFCGSCGKRTHFPQDGSIIGKAVNGNANILLPQADRRRGMYVIGKNGTGKTTFLVNLMLQDIQAGMGLCFIDPHGDAIQDILRRLPKERENDVILLDVLDTKYPFGLNLYECSDPTDLELAARSCEQVMHVFEKVWGAESKTPSWGPQMEDLLRNIALTFIQYQGLTLAEVPFVLTEEIARDKIVGNLKSSQLRLFWNQYARRKDKNDYIASTLNKVRAFLSNPVVEHIVGQAHTTINFRTIMDEGKILLVKLPGRYEDISSLIGGVLIGQLLNAALSRVDIPPEKRHQFNLYVDEYQNFCTPDMATILAESRKFALATTICHQFLDQLDELNRGATLNAANMVVFRVSGQDAEELAKEFDATPPPPVQTGWKPVLAPKREVVEHLLKNGHSNPQYLEAAKWLVVLTEAAGMQFDRPDYYQTDNLIAGFRQMRAGRHYAQTLQLQQDLKIGIQRLNHLFFEVMRDHNAMLPFPEQLFVTIMQAMEVFDIIKNRPQLITDFCSPDGAQLNIAIQYVQSSTMGSKKRQPQGELIIRFVIAMRQIMQILAAEPVMVDSGQHEPIFDKPRTYADVQNQIATELANLRPYQAKSKLGHMELVLQTFPLASGIDDNALHQRIAAIQQATRAGYCTARLDVEEEIMKRQAELIEQEDKKRRTKEEETI